MALSGECPILVWMIALNRDYTREEYDFCHALSSMMRPRHRYRQNNTNAYLLQSQSNSSVNRHTRRFACDVCGSVVRRKPDLKRHMETHNESAERLKCEFCPYTCLKSQKSNLKAHMRRHTGERPLVCGFRDCDFRCGDPSSLCRHRKQKDHPAPANLRKSRGKGNEAVPGWSMPGAEELQSENARVQSMNEAELGMTPCASSDPEVLSPLPSTPISFSAFPIDIASSPSSASSASPPSTPSSPFLSNQLPVQDYFPEGQLSGPPLMSATNFGELEIPKFERLPPSVFMLSDIELDTLDDYESVTGPPTPAADNLLDMASESVPLQLELYGLLPVNRLSSIQDDFDWKNSSAFHVQSQGQQGPDWFTLGLQAQQEQSLPFDMFEFVPTEYPPHSTSEQTIFPPEPVFQTDIFYQSQLNIGSYNFSSTLAGSP